MTDTVIYSDRFKKNEGSKREGSKKERSLKETLSSLLGDTAQTAPVSRPVVMAQHIAGNNNTQITGESPVSQVINGNGNTQISGNRPERFLS